MKHELKRLVRKFWHEFVGIISYETDNNLIDKIINAIHTKYAVVAISHSNYLENSAGVEKAMLNEQMCLFENGVSYLNIISCYGSKVLGLCINKTFIGWFHNEHITPLLSALEESGLVFLRTLIHHTLFHSNDNILSIVKQLNKKTYFYLHDLLTVCPNYILMYNDTRYCHLPKLDSELCSSCHYGAKRTAHVNRYNELFSSYAFEFIAPSHVVADTFNVFFNNSAVRVVPHLIERGVYHKPFINPKIRVAFLGHPTQHKGFLEFSKLVERYKETYDFFLLGSSCPIANVIHVPVSIHDKRTMIDFLREYNIDIAFIYSIWPETYCYTYFESLAAGCFVVTSKDSGNVNVMVNKRKNGIAFDTTDDMLTFFANESRVRASVDPNPTAPLELLPNNEISMEIIRDVSSDSQLLNRERFFNNAEIRKLNSILYKQRRMVKREILIALLRKTVKKACRKIN